MRTNGLVTALAAFAMIAGGCGQGGNQADVRTGTPQEALGFLSSSAQKTLDANSFRVRTSLAGVSFPACMAEAMAAQSAPRELAFDLRTGISTLVDEQGGVKAITTKGTVFVRASALPASWAAPRAWVSVPTMATADDAASWHYGPLFARLGIELGTSRTSNDPQEMLAQIQGAAASVETLGTETIDGVTATRFRVTLDRAKAQERAAAAARERPPTATVPPEKVDELAASDVPLPEYETWVGDDGLVRRITVTYPPPEPTTTSGPTADDVTALVSGPTSATIEFSDYGTTLPAGPPDAAEVVAVGQLPATILESGLGLVDPTCVPGAVTDPAMTESIRAYEQCQRDAFLREAAGQTVDQYVAAHQGGVVPSSSVDPATDGCGSPPGSTLTTVIGSGTP